MSGVKPAAPINTTGHVRTMDLLGPRKNGHQHQDPENMFSGRSPTQKATQGTSDPLIGSGRSRSSGGRKPIGS